MEILMIKSTGIVLIVACFIPSLAMAKVDCEVLKGGIHSAKVIKVADGDTATVRLDSGRSVVVRFYGVDTPEKERAKKWAAQPFSEEPKTFTEERLSDRVVTVKFNGDKTYGRCVGEIFIDDRSHSLALIEGGYAWWYKRYAAKRSDLKRAQENAKANKMGLWAESDPQAPWAFRKAHR